MATLDLFVRQGKALYVGISNYNAEQTKRATEILESLGTPCLIHQPKYSMQVRWVENALLDVLEDKGVGCIPFSPLAQGLLTDKYLNGIPADSRAAKSHGFLQKDEVNDEVLAKIRALHAIAEKRGQSLAQMAIAWLLKDDRITSVLIGASRPAQLANSLDSLNNLSFSNDELKEIEGILKNKP